MQEETTQEMARNDSNEGRMQASSNTARQKWQHSQRQATPDVAGNGNGSQIE